MHHANGSIGWKTTVHAIRLCEVEVGLGLLSARWRHEQRV